MRWGLWLCLVACPARATLIAEETFSYAAGSDLAGQNGGSGWAGAWTTSAPAGSFTMAALAGEPGGVAESGSALTIKDGLTYTRIFRALDCSVGSPADNAGVVESVATVFGTQ